jgi:hypothetical protein
MRFSGRRLFLELNEKTKRKRLQHIPTEARNPIQSNNPCKKTIRKLANRSASVPGVLSPPETKVRNLPSNAAKRTKAAAQFEHLQPLN